MTDTVQSGPRLDESGLEQLLAGLTAVRGGDFSTRLAKTGDPLMDEIATVFNGMADQLDLFTSEVTRVAREVGTEGELGGQANCVGTLIGDPLLGGMVLLGNGGTVLSKGRIAASQ